MTTRLALLLMLVLGPQAVGAQVYEVIAQKGSIAIKSPMDTQWRMLKGKTIPLGSLLRTDPGARIELALKSGVQGEQTSKKKIRIVQAMITRLDEDLIRRMQTKPYPLKGIWELGAEAQREIKDSPLLSFASSFVRSIVTLDKTPKLPPLVDQNPEEEAVQIGAQFLPIKILSPAEDAMFFLNGNSVRIPLIWNPPQDGLRYRIFVWPADGVRGAPMLTQKESWYSLSLTKAGQYRVQIEDETHRYRSTALSLRVEKDLSPGSCFDALAPPLLKLEYPLERATVWISRTDQEYKQRFSWADQSPLRKNERYRLSVLKDGKVTSLKPTRLNTATLTLGQGEYSWFVEKIGIENSLRSPTRQLAIQKGSIGDLSRKLSKTQGQTIFVKWD